MTEEKIKSSFEKLKKALVALEAVAPKPPGEDRDIIDASIQRFKITFELFWKFLKFILESKNIEVNYPRDALEQAYQIGLIENQSQWIQMLKDKNLTPYTYDEKLADNVYINIKSHLPLMRETFEKLKVLYYS